ncbi:MAG: carbohydrate-binding protein [Bacteroidales bacterium]|nr:carbohydrate-binding protein [Bacteroidales bacterium]
MGAIGLNVDGLTAVATLSVPNTGGWATWKTIETTVDLTAGVHVLRLKANQGGFNINYMEFSSDIEPTIFTLKSGYNLFALPVHVADSSVKGIFANVPKFVIKSIEDYYSTENPVFLNSLTHLSTNKGYLVYNAGNDVEITLLGDEVTGSPRFDNLSNGWYLVGNSGSNLNITSFPQYVSEAKNFTSRYKKGDATSTFEVLEKGKACYIKIVK